MIVLANKATMIQMLQSIKGNSQQQKNKGS